ncbi:hypothetical protein CYMTET_43427 [Cymbomonas tetramitiformis]|uniref:Uncharacterized protein n=1 Tax=Cymbomonas tetramitiformis TaxID=36881 RepID=A0AAE0C234_9CHLO|nr:hypothetical protein CYMTET_43427 [Cymbomonas tetramitiformis]
MRWMRAETVAAPQEPPPPEPVESTLSAAKATSVSPGKPAAGLVSTDTMVASYTSTQWQSAVPSAQASASASAAS